MSRNFYIAWPVQLVGLLLSFLLTSQQICVAADLQENVYEPGNFRVLLPGEAKFTTAASAEGEFGKMLLHQGMLSRPGVQIAVWSAHDPIGIIRKYTIEERRENLYDLMISMVKSALPNAKEEISKTPYTFLGLATEKVTLKLRDGNRWWEKQMATVYINNINYLVEVLLSGDESSRPALSQAEVDRIFQSFTRLHEPEKQAPVRTRVEGESDWRPLLNESTFDSWKQTGKEENVFNLLSDGTLRALGGSDNSETLLVAPGSYTNFEIVGELLASLSSKGDAKAGILLIESPQDDEKLKSYFGGVSKLGVAAGGWEIRTNSKDLRLLFSPWGTSVLQYFDGRHGVGMRQKGDQLGLFLMQQHQPDQWHPFYICSLGDKVSVSIGGRVIYQGEIRPSQKLIALVHGNEPDGFASYFRNLRIRTPNTHQSPATSASSGSAAPDTPPTFSGKWVSERMWLTIQPSPSGAVTGTFGRPHQEPVGQLRGAVRGRQLGLKYQTPSGAGDMQIELLDDSQAIVRWRKTESSRQGWDGEYVVKRLLRGQVEGTSAAGPVDVVTPPANGKSLLNQALAHFTGTAGSVDYDAARTLFQKAASTSDPLAQMWLARLLARGDAGIQKNAEEAQDLARKAIDRIEQLANENDGDAMFLLWTAYEDGLGIDKDEQAGLSWLHRSAEAGNTNGQFALGRHLLREKQGATGAKWLEQAAKSGHISARGALGAGYLLGEGLEEDKPKGLKMVHQAAEKGDPRSQNLLGECYELGWGIEKDGVIAARWYELAARQGLPQAAYNLAMLYQGGKGIVRDEKKLAQWLQQAADGDVTDAIYSLGLCYFDEIGVEKNSKKAVELLEIAADRSVAWAAYELGRRYQSGEDVEQNDTLAVKWLTKAAEQNLADSQALLGYQYLFGKGVDVDKAYAMQLIRKAAKQGVGIAQAALGEAYLFGNGIEIDYAKARYWLEKGAASDNEIAAKAARVTLAKLEQAKVACSSAKEVTQFSGSGYQRNNYFQPPASSYAPPQQSYYQQQQAYWSERNAQQQAEYRRAAAQYSRQKQGY